MTCKTPRAMSGRCMFASRTRDLRVCLTWIFLYQRLARAAGSQAWADVLSCLEHGLVAHQAGPLLVAVCNAGRTDC